MDRLEALKLVDSRPLVDDPERLRDRAARDGYVFVRSLIDAETIDALRKKIEASPSQAAIQSLAEFQSLREDPRIRDLLTRILGATPVSGLGDVCRIVSPSDVTTAPHQDHFYTRRSAAMWTVWIPVVDCPALLGGLMVLPGSHRDGLRAHDHTTPAGFAIDIADDANWASADYRAGDALCFNALTVHAARPNVTADAIRISVDFRYAPS